jgi:hypothetical protein
MGKIFGGKPKGPSQAELAAAQESAAQRERDRMAREAEQKKIDEDTKAVADLQSAESKRRAFAGQLSGEQDEEQRRRFLKGA